MLIDAASDAAQIQEEIKRVQADSLNRPFGAWHGMSLFKILLDNKTESEHVGVTVQGVRRLMKQGRKSNGKESL